MVAVLVCQPMVASVPSTPPSVDPARLEAHVKKLSVDFYPRSFDHAANLQRTAAYIEEQFKEAGAQVSIQDVLVDKARYKNVVARFGPEHGRLLVIGAHYDSHGTHPARTTMPVASLACWNWRTCWASPHQAARSNWWHTPWKSRRTSAHPTWVACGMPAR